MYTAPVLELNPGAPTANVPSDNAIEYLRKEYLKNQNFKYLSTK